MKIALGAAYHRKAEVRELAAKISRIGHTVLCRWIDEPDRQAPNRKALIEWANLDLDDIRQCHYFIRLTDDLSDPLVPSALATGGRFVEMGYALALGKTVVVLGGVQSIYDNLENVRRVRNETVLLRMLSPEEVN
jgi:hypothetical protein